MKKLILLIAALFIFIGCTPVPETEISNTQVTIEDTAATPDPENVFVSDVINNGQAITSAITEDTDQYSINVQFPKFDGQDTLNELLKNIAITEVDAFKKQVADIYNDENFEVPEGISRSYLENYYRIIRNDSKIISVLFQNQTYSVGAAHPMTYSITVNWDVQNNKKIEWTDIIVGDQNIPMVLSELVKPKLYEILEVDAGVISDWIEEGAGADPANFQSYSISPNGITINFDPYQVGPYALGPVNVDIPFEDFGVLLNKDLVTPDEL